MRWSSTDKVIGIAILYKSPQAYHLLRTMFSLPSITVLKNYLCKIKLAPGFVNSTLLFLLKKHGELMSSIDKHCLIVIDAMCIKSQLKYDQSKNRICGRITDGYGSCSLQIATHAFVVMIRGLASNWKFIMGYVFIHNTLSDIKLKNVVDKVVTAAESVGFLVHGCVMDLEINQQKFCKTFCTAQNNNWMVHPCDNSRKFWVFFDPPHLLKCIRNNLHKYWIKFGLDDFCARWEHLQEFWSLEKKGEIRLCPKVSDRHFNYGNFEKMKVKLAAQIFSHSVA